jgi:hypothetical protein
MKTSTIIKALLGAGLITAVGFELGLIQQAFDSRSVIRDGVVGADFWIVEVDGKRTDRIKHGVLITKVPLALVEPGDRVMKLALTPRLSDERELVEFHAKIERGVDYRISRNKEGKPELVATNNE